MQLLGIDVGFSRKRATTGVAILDGSDVVTFRVRTSWDERRKVIPPGFAPDVIALDGPLLPSVESPARERYCEYLFSYAPFQNRCKPGLSHWGFGLNLRTATAEACAQFSSLLMDGDLIHRDGKIIEAFPNAFLGVLTSEDVFKGNRVGRQSKFDWLYDNLAATGELQEKLDAECTLPERFWAEVRRNRDHEIRAALICLLTAALRAAKIALPIGDDLSGWFWLPPLRIWQPWARSGLDQAHERARLRLSKVKSLAK